MEYKLVKGTNPTIPSYGKYVARAVHNNVITAHELALEIQNNCSAKKSDVLLVLTELQDSLIRHLQAGDKIELPAIGTLKLEMDSRTVDSPEEFNPAIHLRKFSLHLLPKCTSGTPDIYTDVPLTEKKPLPSPPLIGREP